MNPPTRDELEHLFISGEISEEEFQDTIIKYNIKLIPEEAYERLNELNKKSKPNPNVLWSDTSGNDAFENDHGVWDFFRAVN